LKYTYKYLGIRGIRIEGKDYETGSIVKLDRPITEFGFSGIEFEELRNMSERKELRIALKSFERKREEAKERYNKELEKLKIEATRRFEHELKILDDKTKNALARIDEISKSYEKKPVEPEKKEVIKKPKGGRG